VPTVWTAELDRIEDELFSTDYLLPSQRRHDSVLPELPTLRLPARARADEATVRLRPHPSPLPTAPRYVTVQGLFWRPAPERPGIARSSRTARDEDGPAGYAVMIGLVALVIVAGAAVIVWWLA
jgi:hypothetical protein